LEGNDWVEIINPDPRLLGRDVRVVASDQHLLADGMTVSVRNNRR
jgi:hypothetical protein